MEFRLLGPVEVYDEAFDTASGAGRRVWLGGRRERTMLAVLLLAGRRVVPLDRLVDAVWGDEPPPTARRQVHTGMSTLRRALGARLLTRDPGYLLDTAHDDVDLARFDAAVSAARVAADAGRGVEAADGLRAALALCRGPVLGGVPGLAGERARLDEQRLAVLAERIDLDLALGRHAELTGELAALVAEHPLCERFTAQLMLALYRCGRRVEALQVYRDARSALVEDLGLEPPAELTSLEQAILAGDPTLAAASRPERRAPCLLPADIADLTGRDAVAAEVGEALLGGDGVTVCAIAGRGGVGKTVLAVHVAHRLRASFPGGQLHVDLRGAGATPADPAEVLARFLRALGEDGAAIPAGLDERAERYRDLVAGRRVLVVLDNARDAAHVEPLLPGAGCGVLVTSRARLGGLAGAHHVELAELTTDEALRLLVRVAGSSRVDAEPDASAELVRLCERLPLAVRIAGAKLAGRPHWPVAELVRRLADERGRLDELAHGGLAVRAGVGLSYQGLDADARRLLRRLGLLDAPDFAAWTCAALLDAPTAPAGSRAGELAGELAERLVEARLLQATGPGRYRLHDLVRCFARERAAAEETTVTRDAALGRVLGGWLALAERAHRTAYGADDVIVHGDAPRWLPDGADALVADPGGWMDRERLGLVAAVRQAAALGRDELAWDLALSSIWMCATRWYVDEWRQTHDAALAATLAAGNRRGEAAIRYGLGALHDAHCDYPAALRSFERAAELFEAVGERRGYGLALVYRSHIARRLGRFDLALADAARGRELTMATGDRAGEASALRSTAQTRLAIGELDAVAAPLTEALAIVTAAGNRRDEGQVLRDLGELHLRRGALPAAESAFDRVLAIVRELGDRTGESFALLGLGECHLRQGRLDAASGLLTEGLALARAVGTRFIETRLLTALGELARAQGLAELAVERLRDAAARWRELGSPQWLARTLRSLGEAEAAAQVQAQATRMPRGSVRDGVRSRQTVTPSAAAPSTTLNASP